MLNEPETSLHPELLPALAALMRRAAEDSQLVVVTHSEPLAAALGREGVTHHELELDTGETVVAGREGPLDQPAWHWPKR